ncbi:PAS domain S-box-containing protein [Geothermobacter ehrlichii]|uniref:histidine kinase n=1 Tax=Geothermobacter ehrlichii TaxID=213224 RepID=A0A5D3WHH1_9BACT|nr:ATP-binding protein [Geothermobacter ehrlichii]TYO95812.1 PAS domain S-box-containing protein [Geothermobacter ehrlichii]
MKPLKPGRKIILLVWVLVMIGLFVGVVTNGLIGWTLHDLNQERLRLVAQERRLTRGAEQLRRLSRQAQSALGSLLQLDLGPITVPFPDRELEQLRQELEKTSGVPDIGKVNNELGQQIHSLRRIWQQAVAWRADYRPVYLDSHERKSLRQVRHLLQKLRADLEIFEGRQRLAEARKIRRWRQADPATADLISRELLGSGSQTWRRSLDAVNTELVDLSRMIEILAGEDRLDQLVDLKDNQLKPSLERLDRELRRLRSIGLTGTGELPADPVDRINEALFGRGYTIYREYQTILPGKGGLYQLVSRQLDLMQQREQIQREATRELQRLESLYPPLASLTQKRNQELARQAEHSLANGALNLFMLSLLTLGGFLGLGFLIVRMTKDQIAAMTSLRRQNELILTSAGEGVLGVNSEGRIVFINPSAERMLGWNNQRLTGRHYSEILPGKSGRQAADPIRNTLKKGDSYRGDETVFRRRDDSRVPVACAVTPMLDENRQIEGAVITFMDISDRKAAEQTLRRYYDRLAEQEKALAELNRDLERKVVERTLELEEKSRQLIAAKEELAHAEKLAAIGSLAAGVAHEINNPTAIIRGNVEILRARLSGDRETLDETGEILRQVERISLITGNLLAFARKQNLALSNFDLPSLLAEILDQVSHQVPTENIDLQLSPAPDLPPCRGDRERLRQVFTNIIVNGLQAMPGGGRLTITCEHDHRETRVRILDTGPGIPAEIRKQIFHPFFTTKTDGTGLGLSVSYGIVQAHGGRIVLQSEPGRGSCFTVSLPRPIRDS